MRAFLSFPWAQAALWLLGLLLLLTGAGNEFGANWGSVVAGAVLIAAAISLAFLRIFRRKHQPLGASDPPGPATDPTVLKRRRLFTRLVLGWVVLLVGAIGVGLPASTMNKRLWTYENVRLGVTRAEISYRLGPPPVVLGETEEGGWRSVYYTDRDRDPRNAMPEASEAGDYATWLYEARNAYSPELTVEFNGQDRVERIICISTEQTNSTCAPLFGVHVGTSEDALTSRLGRPTRAEIEGVTKHIRYADLGVEYWLVRGRVYRMALTDAKGDAGVLLSRYFRIWFSLW